MGDWIIDKPATVETAGSRHKECETCGAILEKEEIKKLELPAYKIIDGAESTWTQNTNTDGSLVIRGDGAIANFKEVRVDGVVIDVKNYTVTEGSTIITLKTEYLKPCQLESIHLKLHGSMAQQLLISPLLEAQPKKIISWKIIKWKIIKWKIILSMIKRRKITMSKTVRVM